MLYPFLTCIIDVSAPIEGFAYSDLFTAEIAIILNPDKERLRAFSFGFEVSLVKDTKSTEKKYVLGFTLDDPRPVVICQVEQSGQDLHVLNIRKVKFAEIAPVYNKVGDSFAPSRINLSRSDAVEAIRCAFDPKKKKKQRPSRRKF